jgi:hypothetical protein
MNKSSWRLPLLASPSTDTFAQQPGTDQDEKACRPDVKRFWRKWMDQSDSTALACLKENRTGLHQACLDADQTWAFAATACPALHDTPLARDTFVFD